MTPTGWTISKRGAKWVLRFENTKFESVLDVSQWQFEKFTRESMRKLGIKEAE